MEEPLTDYLRYEMAVYAKNAEAGEEIRLIGVSRSSWPVGVPQATDFWLFDDKEVWDMHYDDSGQFRFATRSTSQTHLEWCRQWRDEALRQSIDLSGYARRTA